MSKDYFDLLIVEAAAEQVHERPLHLVANLPCLLKRVASDQREAIAAEIENLRDPYFLVGKSREEILDRVLKIVGETILNGSEKDR